MMITLLTAAYIACFQGCAWPAIIRVWRRRSSDDLSIWREVLLIIGASTQLYVALALHAPWNIWMSPVMTLISVSGLLAVVWRFRR